MKRIGCGAILMLLGGFLTLGAVLDSPTKLGIFAMAGIAILFLIGPGALLIYSTTPSGRKAFAIGDAAPTSSAGATVAKPDPDDAVIELLQLYGKTREGFYGSANGPSESRVREIGRELDARGGKELMREAHARFARMTNTPGGARNLEIMWDGIGSWRG